eukprot:6098886-Lingulodinium_polyedra.AAC.1
MPTPARPKVLQSTIEALQVVAKSPFGLFVNKDCQDLISLVTKKVMKMAAFEIPTFASSPWWCQLRMAMASFVTHPAMDVEVEDLEHRV